MQAFNLGALGGVVVGLAFSRAPLIQIVQLLRGLVGGQFWIGNEIDHQAKAQGHCHQQPQQNTVKQTHSNAPCKNMYSLMP